MAIKNLRAKSLQFNNVIKIIHAYKYYNGWVFDDREAKLDKESFVAGADSMCDYMANGGSKVTIQFSDIEFPSHKLKAEYVSGQVDTGTNYFCKELDQPLWLCPALGAFFETSPKTIFINFI